MKFQVPGSKFKVVDNKPDRYLKPGSWNLELIEEECMMTRHAEPRSHLRVRWLAIAIAGGLLAFAGTGCNRNRSPEGGANTEKAKQARKQAEATAMAAVKSAADAQARAVPGAARDDRGFVQKAKDWWDGKPAGSGSNVSTQVAPPSAPKPAAPPPAPPTPSPPAVVVKPRSDAAPNVRSSSPVVIRDKVTSDIPYPTEAEAFDNAIAQAQKRITQALAQLDPPVRYEPSINVVKNEFVRKDTRTVRKLTDAEKAQWKELGYSDDRVFVDIDVEVTADQVRELRTQDRVSDALRVLGGLAAVALAGFLFLRADEYTKGYLTSWLAFIAIALAGGAAAALVLV